MGRIGPGTNGSVASPASSPSRRHRLNRGPGRRTAEVEKVGSGSYTRLGSHGVLVPPGVGEHHPLDRIALQPVKEEAHVLDVVPPLDSPGRLDVDGMRHLIEPPVDAVHRVDVPDVGPSGLEPQMVEVLGPPQQLEELDCVGAPAGDVTRQLLQHRQGALASPVVDRLGDIDPGPRPGVVDGVVGHQVADVGDDPIAGRSR